MGYFCPKNTFLQLKDDIHRIYPALLSTTCVKIHQRTYVIFEPPAQPLYIFLAQTLHTFCKNSLSKWKFNTCHCLQYKVHPIPHVIFGSKSQFFFKLCITLQCHETNSAVLFHLNLYVLWTKESDQVKIFRLSTTRMKINQFPYVFFQATNQLSLKFCITLQCHDT